MISRTKISFYMAVKYQDKMKFSIRHRGADNKERTGDVHVAIIWFWVFKPHSERWGGTLCFVLIESIFIENNSINIENEVRGRLISMHAMHSHLHFEALRLCCCVVYNGQRSTRQSTELFLIIHQVAVVNVIRGWMKWSWREVTRTFVKFLLLLRELKW